MSRDDDVPGPEITRQIYETPTMTSNNIRTVNIAIFYQFTLGWGRYVDRITSSRNHLNMHWVDENKEKIKYNIISLAGAGLVEILMKSCHYC